jgi:tricorn protease-like protein
MVHQVPRKPSDYLSMAGQMTSTQTMEIGTKVQTAIEVDQNQGGKVQVYQIFARKVGMIFLNVTSCKTKRGGKTILIIKRERTMAQLPLLPNIKIMMECFIGF